MTNTFEIPDREITLDNYEDWIKKLNSTNPEEIASLRVCELQTFLDQVLLVYSVISLPPLPFYNITLPHSLPHRLRRGQAWLLSLSLKRS